MLGACLSKESTIAFAPQETPKSPVETLRDRPRRIKILITNFEWVQRFGMIHVDYETQKRTTRDSAQRYQQVIQSNGRSLTELSYT